MASGLLVWSPDPYIQIMDSDSIAQLAYLALLGAAVAGWFFAENSQSLGKTARQALIWVLIFVGAIAAVGLWQDIRNDVAPRASQATEGQIDIPRSFNNHFEITMVVNGQPVDFIVDTGATAVVLSPSDAERIGFTLENLNFDGRASTANGVTSTADVTLDEVRFGTVSDRIIPAVVNAADMNQSLLGMTYLNRWDTIEIKNDTLTLSR